MLLREGMRPYRGPAVNLLAVTLKGGTSKVMYFNLKPPR